MFKSNKIVQNVGWSGSSSRNTAEPTAEPEERDREWRLGRFGPGGLTDRELISCVLGPGGRISASEAAGKLLESYRGLGELAAEQPELAIMIEFLDKSERGIFR